MKTAPAKPASEVQASDGLDLVVEVPVKNDNVCFGAQHFFHQPPQMNRVEHGKPARFVAHVHNRVVFAVVGEHVSTGHRARLARR